MVDYDYDCEVSKFHNKIPPLTPWEIAMYMASIQERVIIKIDYDGTLMVYVLIVVAYYPRMLYIFQKVLLRP